MEEKLKLLEELYDLTLRQQKAINLGLIPRFMRLLDQREQVIKKIEELKVDKDENLEYDKLETKINDLSQKVLELDKKNLEELNKQKIQAKSNVEKITMTKKIIFDTYDKMENQVGNHFDNKQ
ncbi:MAG: hypothetical protein MJ244_06365 [Clostridia bacterium]|nr:hypothetical protein [Clostridia bacterium]